MSIDRDLIALRDWGFQRHRGWKQRTQISDLITQGQFDVVWPDLSQSKTGALVENVYVEALYDKAASAASVTPQVEVAPTRGTREDRAEGVAQKRRRAFRTFMLTALDDQIQWVLDWLQLGVMYAMPWKDSDDRYPYAMRFDPRWAFPLAHNAKGELTQAFFMRYRPLHELKRDYGGTENDALNSLNAHFASRGWKEPTTVEELWYVDDKVWGMAVVAAEHPTPDMFRYVDPLKRPSDATFADWVIPKTAHNMSRCPVVEKRRRTADGEYRGALDDMIPNMKVAQNLMARVIEMLDIQTATPIGLDNVANPDQFKPGGILRGTGEGDLKIVIPQWPANFEAMAHVDKAIDAARNVGAYPQQRSGEHGASIASGKASQAVMGAFNVQLAWNQRDLASFYRNVLNVMAEFDEKWCPGVKDITGWDEGEIYSDTYNPESFWKGDYRCEITFNRVGLEEHNWMTRLGLFKNMNGLSSRSLMRKSGMIDNPLAEEAEMDLEKVKDAFFTLVGQQALQGNGDPLYKYAMKIDGDKMSPRQAMWATIKEMRLVTAEGRPVPGQGAGVNPGQAMLAEKSLDAGGMPGSAAGLPPPRVGGALAGMLPPGMGRALADIAPAGR